MVPSHGTYGYGRKPRVPHPRREHGKERTEPTEVRRHQSVAPYHYGCPSVLVSVAHGSGVTHVLSERSE